MKAPKMAAPANAREAKFWDGRTGEQTMDNEPSCPTHKVGWSSVAHKQAGAKPSPNAQTPLTVENLAEAIKLAVQSEKAPTPDGIKLGGE